MLVDRLGLREVSDQVPLFHVVFWVHVYDLPVGFMLVNVRKQLRNYMGEFLEYDGNNNSSFWKNYIQINCEEAEEN